MDLRGSLVDVGGFPVDVDGHSVDVREILHQVFDRCPIDVGGFPVDARGSLVIRCSWILGGCALSFPVYVCGRCLLTLIRICGVLRKLWMMTMIAFAS